MKADLEERLPQVGRSGPLKENVLKGSGVGILLRVVNAWGNGPTIGSDKPRMKL